MPKMRYLLSSGSEGDLGGGSGGLGGGLGGGGGTGDGLGGGNLGGGGGGGGLGGGGGGDLGGGGNFGGGGGGGLGGGLPSSAGGIGGMPGGGMPGSLAPNEPNVKDMVLSNGSFGPREIKEMVDFISSDTTRVSVLRDSVQEFEQRDTYTPAESVRLGVCQFLLGKYNDALGTLRSADGGALAHFYMARANLAVEKYDDARSSYESAKTAGYNPDECALGIAQAYRLGGKLEEAMSVLDNLSGAVEQTAEYLYQRASTVSAMGSNPEEACALFERAVENDPAHSGALFGLALENDRRGNDFDALELYERATMRFPAHIGSLLNLGILYEDREQYDKAAKCYQRILDSYPAQ